MNVYCHYKYVADDTIYYDTPAIDDGSTWSHLFVGTKLLVSYVYGMRIDHQFVNTLEENIRSWSAMSKFISDRNQSYVWNCAQSILWGVFIDYWNS